MKTNMRTRLLQWVFLLLGLSISGPLLAQGQVLLVVGDTASLTTNDIMIRDRLISPMGYTVTLVSDEAVGTAALSSQDLVVVSSSTHDQTIGTELTSVSVPVLCLNRKAYDELDMTTTTSRGSGKTDIRIEAPSHPLAAGKTGFVTVFSSGQYMGWGTPAGAGTTVSIMGWKAERGTIFAYDAGETMVSITAPARRTGFFLSETAAAAALTTDGWELFDSAACWTMGPACYGGGSPPNQAPQAFISRKQPTQRKCAPSDQSGWKQFQRFRWHNRQLHLGPGRWKRCGLRYQF